MGTHYKTEFSVYMQWNTCKITLEQCHENFRAKSVPVAFRHQKRPNEAMSSRSIFVAFAVFSAVIIAVSGNVQVCEAAVEVLS